MLNKQQYPIHQHPCSSLFAHKKERIRVKADTLLFIIIGNHSTKEIFTSPIAHSML